MRELRVLVFSASFGAGHMRAAGAVIEALKQKVPGVTISHLDYGDTASRLLNYAAKNAYISVTKRVPKLWGKLYQITDMRTNSAVQRFSAKLGRKELEKQIESFCPDLVVCTFPTAAGVAAQLRMKGTLNVPLVTVITDYSVHTHWIYPGVDMYLVGCAEVYQKLAAEGISPERIRVTGIPVSPTFEQSMDKEVVATKLGLKLDRPTVLIMAGAYGVLQDIEQICRIFAETTWRAQLVVVCGRNEKLYQSLADVQLACPDRIFCFGYVESVEEVMAISDIMISKAGGLIVSEALTRRLPQLIYKPIPGQEENNAVFLNNIGAGKVARTLNELKESLQHLLYHPEDRTGMQDAAAKAVPEHAAENAVAQMLALIEKRQ